MGVSELGQRRMIVWGTCVGHARGEITVAFMEMLSPREKASSLNGWRSYFVQTPN